MTQLHRFKFMFISAVLLMALISGCLPSGPTQVAEKPEAPGVDVRVIPTGEPLVRVVQTEKIVQPNCGGTLEVENVVERSRTIIHTVELGGGVEVNARGQVGLLGTGVQVGAAIAAQYGQSYGTEDTLTRAITVKAKEGTNMEHTIQQVEIWQCGTVEITIGDQQFTYPYYFRNDFSVELVKSQNIGCPPTEGVPSTATPTPTNTISPTPKATLAPTSTSRPTPTNMATATNTPAPTAIPAPISTPPAALFDDVVTVQAKEKYRFDNIELHPGNIVTVQYLSGTWTIGEGQYPHTTAAGLTPGEDKLAGWETCKFTPDATLGTLVAGIQFSEHYKWYVVGEFATFEVSSTGFLILSINDDCPGDNSGSVKVHIVIK